MYVDPNWREGMAELVGTFALVFCGAGAVTLNAAIPGSVGLVGIALAHGLAIMAMVYALGQVSGGHFNPAVTFAMVLTGRTGFGKGFSYGLAQCAGAAIAALLLKETHPGLAASAPFLGSCDLRPGLSAGHGAVLEAVMTFLLVTVIFGSAVDPRASKGSAGIAIGLTISACILMGGPLTGAALNPARAFGPAFASGHWDHHALYWIGPLAGAAAAALLSTTCFLPRTKA